MKKLYHHQCHIIINIISSKTFPLTITITITITITTITMMINITIIINLHDQKG